MDAGNRIGFIPVPQFVLFEKRFFSEEGCWLSREKGIPPFHKK
jgi:hypothetical protein